MRTVALANLTRFTLVLNLPHDVVPELSTRGVVGTRDHDATTGQRPVRAHKKKISGSITLMPKGMDGDILRGLPESVLQAADVDRALKAWPPKLASKTLSKDEREAEDKELAVAAEKQAAGAKTDAEYATTKAAVRAKIAVGPVPAESDARSTPAPPVVTASKPAEREAREAGSKER